MHRLTALALVLLIPAACAAADLSLPLSGYYRAGRYMPVRFGPSSVEVRISATGAVPTLIPAPTPGGIAPWLVTNSPVTSASFTLHELKSDEKLVGYAASAPDLAAALFPGQTILPVMLDPANPLPGPPCAWQSLNAVVLDAASAKNLSPAARDCFLAGGTTLAVQAAGSAAPDDLWPWQLQHGFWILRAPPSFPAVASDDFYAPAAGWQPAAPASFRRDVVLLAIIEAIGFLFLRPLPRIAAIIAAAFWALAAALGIYLWDIRHSPMLTAQGTVHVASAPASGFPSSVDIWVFQRAFHDCSAAAEFYELAFPLLPAGGVPDSLLLHCTSTGQPVEFTYNLTRDRPAAFVFKSVTSAPIPTNVSPNATSPLRLIPAALYPGAAILGEGTIHPSGDPTVTQWPPLLLERSDAIPINVSPPATRDSSNR